MADNPLAARVFHGDSLELVRAWPAGTIDLVYIDPPFGTGKTQRGRGGTYADGGGDPEAHVA